MTKDEILNMPAGREMDALISAKVFSIMPFKHPGENQEELFLPAYSTDISAAWEVVEKLDPFDFELVRNADKSWDCLIWNRAKENRLWEAKKIYVPDISDAPLAICRAALLAQEYKK